MLTSSTFRVRIVGNGTIVSLVELASGREVLPQGRGVRLTLRPFEVVTLRLARSAEGALGA